MALSGTGYDALQVKGLSEAVKALRAIGAPASEIKQAGLESAKLVAVEGRRQAPSRTGNLIRSIRSYATLKGAGVRAGNAKVPYANPIHWGWFYDKNNFIEKNIKPNPFFSRALGYKREEIEATYTENMNKLLRKWNQPTR
jgi:hypothetical protein